jgi:hypothetical protein
MFSNSLIQTFVILAKSEWEINGNSDTCRRSMRVAVGMSICNELEERGVGGV